MVVLGFLVIVFEKWLGLVYFLKDVFIGFLFIIIFIFGFGEWIIIKFFFFWIRYIKRFVNFLVNFWKIDIMISFFFYYLLFFYFFLVIYWSNYILKLIWGKCLDLLWYKDWVFNGFFLFWIFLCNKKIFF